MSLSTFKHLLPNARAWRITVDKTLRRFFEGLSGIEPDFVKYQDDIWKDILPETTRFLTEWENEFALPDTGLSESERRLRLDATWKATGGQDPRYIQDTLQAQGFDVFVHEWFDPASIPAVNVKLCVTPRDPRLYLRAEYTGVTVFTVTCGEPLAQCGEPGAQCGEATEPLGYPLVNKITVIRPEFLAQCDLPGVECGEVVAQCGNYAQVERDDINYIVPSDPAKWPYFLYIGGEVFGDSVNVDGNRQNEFEALCLKICPAQQWLGILVQYP